MARTISASVGLSGKNLPEDVRTIQELLNKVPPEKRGPSPPLEVNGVCARKTTEAIQRFQIANFGWSGADGRVDPGGPTLAKLNEYDDAPGGAASPPETLSRRFAIQRLGGNEIFDPNSIDLFFRVLDLANSRAAIYYFQTPRGPISPQEPPGTPSGPLSPFTTSKAFDVTSLNCPAHFTTTDSLGARSSELRLALPPSPVRVMMRHHLRVTNPSYRTVSIYGVFRFMHLD